MRLGTKSQDGFVQEMNTREEQVRGAFFERTGGLVRPEDVKVMLGDGTVTDQKTFDPGRIHGFFAGITGRLHGWTVHNVTVTSNEDIRRIFAKFEVREGNYLISGHLSVQFHVLLYYKPVQRVIDCQKELADVIERAKSGDEALAGAGNRLIAARLAEGGLGSEVTEDPQRLFEELYNDDALREEMHGRIRREAGADFEKISDSRSRLLAELDDHLIEVYHTSPVMIDENRLVGGEEGLVCTLDLEFVRGQKREGLFDPRRIPESAKPALLGRIDEIKAAMDR